MVGGEQSLFAPDDPSLFDKQSCIRRLNDDLRRYGRGGIILLSAGIAALCIDEVHDIMEAVRCFEDFNDDNDPYREHDLGVFRHRGERLLWKIGYYDKDRCNASPDPADPRVTSRILTIMFAWEY